MCALARNDGVFSSGGLALETIAEIQQHFQLLNGLPSIVKCELASLFEATVGSASC